MTKKRFIKLLMSTRVQKSEARLIAARYNSRKMPYSQAFSDYLVKEKLIKSFSKLGAAAVKFGENLEKITESFDKFARACKSSMEGVCEKTTLHR